MDAATLSQNSKTRQLFLYARAIGLSLLLLGPLLLINLMQMLSLCIKPLSLKSFRRINRFLAHWYWSLLVQVAVHILGVSITWQCDAITDYEDAILIANHQTAVDIMPLLALAYKSQRTGDMKFFVKDIFRYIPGPGWGMVFLDFVFLKRRWMSDRRRIKANFERIHKENRPLWLNIFPEGTRFSSRKLVDAQTTARHYKLPLCEHVLVPFAKGFETSLLTLKGKVSAVYDITIGYPAGIPTLWQLMLGQVHVIEVKVDRFPLSQLPTESDAIEKWLYERFWHKELNLRHLDIEGIFPRLQLAK
ncbi:MAG: 1-acyl-sn-glycerol-3-phosphate acyltransferase [Proteobacteria bacterium]|nr:1-acyl-sn-glycerol-3-phosphate acyltransferase [Pseudomonadota bacterium]